MEKLSQAYSSFSSLRSDHLLVTAKIRLSLRMKRTPARKKNYDWSALKNTELQEMYTISVRNRYAELTEESDDITEDYRKFVQSNREAAEKLIPLKKRMKRNKLADDPQIKAARKCVQTAFTQYQTNTSCETQIMLQEGKNKMQNVYDQIREEELVK